MFENIAGQESAKGILESMITSGNIPHALLFAGPYGVGKGEMAIDLASKLLCENGPDSGCAECSACHRASKLEHPDLHILFPFRAPPQSAERRSAWVDELSNHRKLLSGEAYPPVLYEKSSSIVRNLVDEVRERLLESSFEGGRRVCIIFNADKLNPTTSNLLLKILEEPPAGVHFILTTERISSVLPTIISRSSVIKLRRLHENEIKSYLDNFEELDQEKIISYAKSAGGSIKTAKALAFENKGEMIQRSYELYNDVANGGPEDAVSNALLFARSREIVEAEEIINGFVFCTKSVLDKKLGIFNEKNDISKTPDTIKVLSNRTDIPSLNRLSAKLEDGLEMLGRNVNISTVMTTIFYGINDTYR
ncbi:ATP-binding protein [Candidatus Latescibacterota bacterium]